MDTVWTQWACGGGAQWTTARPYLADVEGSICNFSGCGCGTPIRIIGTTTDLHVAHEWFKRP